MNIGQLDKGISLKYFGEISEEILESIHTNGFDCIELSFPLEYFEKINFIQEAEKYKKMADEQKIKIWSIHLPYGKQVDISSIDEKIRKHGIDLYTQLMKSASKIGVKTAVLHPSSEPILDENRKEQIKNSRKSIKELGKKAIELGINLAIENLPRTCLGNTSEELIEIVKDIPNVGICFDSNHSLKENNIKFLTNILSNKISIHTVHLSDYDFVNERHRLPGDGVNDWKKIIETLETIGYNGPIMYEINRHPYERDEITLKQIRKNQENLINITKN